MSVVDVKVDGAVAKEFNVLGRQLFKNPYLIVILILCFIITVLLLILYRSDTRADAEKASIRQECAQERKDLRAEAKEVRELLYQLTLKYGTLSQRVNGLQDSVQLYQSQAILRGQRSQNSNGQ